MRRYLHTSVGIIAVALLLLAGAGRLWADIPGVMDNTVTLTAKEGYISTPEANSIYMWGYALDDGPMQYPGPTLVFTKGQNVEITLVNDLPGGRNVSIVFPGQDNVTFVGGVTGLITQEAPPGGQVTYKFTASELGTYLYSSGTNPELQVEMGLVGAILVKHAGPMTMKAYEHDDTSYDHEVLFLETEIDPWVHWLIESGQEALVDNTEWFPVYWFLNGRCAPDTMLPAGWPLLPSQPYNCMPMIHPGDKLLLRIINAGRDFHPFHTHGNNFSVIARDARILTSDAADPTVGSDLAESHFTITVSPGGTLDAIFTWTGKGLGWDIYGHEQDRDEPPLGNFPGPEDVDHNGNGVIDDVPMDPSGTENAEDHGKPFPVVMPDVKDVTLGTMYSGSPYLGGTGHLPPGEGGFNPTAGFVYMWHSHKEKEMVNNDVFPGGMMTMFIVVPPGVPIPMH
ncbi:MAG: multicopper oxidase domain-containing protein [Verrucomicrobia bacterium]|nr:multicopper oxidase domain-containing protein [Verrucomicrobiota bacterium]